MTRFLPPPVEDHLEEAVAVANGMHERMADGRDVLLTDARDYAMLCVSIALAQAQRRTADALEEHNVLYRKAHDLYK